MINSLEEAIKHCEEVAEENEHTCNCYPDFGYDKRKYKECAKEHRQLAEWLKELKFYRTMIPSASEYFRTGKVNADDDT